MSESSWLSLRPPGAPEAVFSARACPRLSQAQVSLAANQPRWPATRHTVSGVFSTPQALRQMLLERVGKEFDVAMFHGRMEVKGHHVKLIKTWLEKLGF